jgi:hypothetical protein
MNINTDLTQEINGITPYAEFLLSTAEITDLFVSTLMKRCSVVRNIIGEPGPEDASLNGDITDQLPPDEPLIKALVGAFNLIVTAIDETFEASDARGIALFNDIDEAERLMDKFEHIEANALQVAPMLRRLRKTVVM